MRKFIWANFIVAILSIGLLARTYGVYIILGIINGFSTPAILLLNALSIKSYSSSDGFVNITSPTILVTLGLFLLIVVILTKFDKRRILKEQNSTPVRFGLKFITALILLLNMGTIFGQGASFITSLVEKNNYRLATFEQNVDMIQDSSLGFSIKTPSDWIKKEYVSEQYIILIPKKLEEKQPKPFAKLVITPSVSTVNYNIYQEYINKSDVFCKGGFKVSQFAGRSALECFVDNSYEYARLIRITDISGLNTSWKHDNLVGFRLPKEHVNLVPLYEKILSTFSFQ